MLTVLAASQTSNSYSASDLIGLIGLVIGLIGVPITFILGRRVSTQAEDATSQKPLEERLDELSRSMRDSARLVEQVSAELDARAATVKRLKEEAETAEALAAMHKTQAEAVRRMMDAELATAARRIRGDTIKITIISFFAGGGVTFFVTLLVHPLHLETETSLISGRSVAKPGYDPRICAVPLRARSKADGLAHSGDLTSTYLDRWQAASFGSMVRHGWPCFDLTTPLNTAA